MRSNENEILKLFKRTRKLNIQHKHGTGQLTPTLTLIAELTTISSSFKKFIINKKEHYYIPKLDHSRGNYHILKGPSILVHPKMKPL